jgi:hypothetical protein
MAAAAAADANQPVAQLLLGLPDLAGQTLVNSLVAARRWRLKELMMTHPDARQLVARHARRATYRLGSSNRACASSHATLHAMCGRSEDLDLTLHFSGTRLVEGRLELVVLLGQAAQGGKAEGGHAAAGGWRAVRTLTFEVSSGPSLSHSLSHSHTHTPLHVSTF